MPHCAWMQNACNAQLAKEVMHEDGVEALIVLSACNAPDTEVSNAAEAVASILRVVPVDFVSADSYVWTRLLVALHGAFVSVL